MSKYYKIVDSFIAVYNKKHQTISVGNPIILAMPCIEIQLENDNKIYLSNVSHFQKCNLKGDMVNGEHGTAFMLKAALKFAHFIWPNASIVTLTDSSGYIDKTSGINVNLADKTMYMYKKTWYQRGLSDLKLKPCSKYTSTVKSILEILEKVPRSKDRVFLNMKNKVTLYDFIHSVEDAVERYKFILKIATCFKIPSLFFSEWKGKIDDNCFAEVELNVQSIEKPKILKAQWGGIGDALDIGNLPNQTFRH